MYTRKKWEMYFTTLQHYFNKNGHSNFSNYSTNRSFIRWIEFNRNNKEVLTSSQLNNLNSVNFIFDLDESRWQYYLSKLETYYELYGTGIVNINHLDYRDLRLWIYQTRKMKDLLSREKRNELYSKGIIFSLHISNWEKNYWILRDTLNKGIKLESILNDSEYSTLKKWIFAQKRGLLSNTQIDLLNKLSTQILKLSLEFQKKPLSSSYKIKPYTPSFVNIGLK